MTTGRLHIFIADLEVDGTFENGKIVSGKIVSPNCTRIGTFDKDQQLHGDNCIEQSVLITQRGYFEHGYFQRGEMITPNRREEGIFKGLHLIEGKRTQDGVFSDGSFRCGKIIYGAVQYPNGEIHEGIFNNECLTRGMIKNRDATFEAIVSHDEYDVLTECTARFSGNPKTLTGPQLMYYCCQGVHVKEAYKVYKTFLSNFTLDGLFMLKEDAIVSSNPRDIIGFKQIFGNIMSLKSII